MSTNTTELLEQDNGESSIDHAVDHLDGSNNEAYEGRNWICSLDNNVIQQINIKESTVINLKELIVEKWNMEEEVFQKLLLKRCSLHTLKVMNYEDIKIIFPDEEIGYRIDFISNLTEWRTAMGLDCDNLQNTSVQKACSGSTDTISNCSNWSSTTSGWSGNTSD